MKEVIDFEIQPQGAISQAFLARAIFTFFEAAAFIQHLPYGRNANKEDLLSLFDDGKGTCSTKHAVLKQLAIEQNFDGLQLIMGIFKMNSLNTPLIASTLTQYNLSYIPEAHMYLGYKGERLDFTRVNSSAADFQDDLLEECEIQPDEIAEVKVGKHQLFIENWLVETPEIPYSLKEIWSIREQCILDLSV
ncbi:hypothetical protein HX004_01910 [Myroides sp. 1354]|uniref:hypothetical protein n=1 Tax=unclassified Myroides TaxID=2642485 RepID=UPI0025788365|nr:MULTISPECIES: hypothetical protein [unclassified Myroides]MDM1043406.1 hypothetical protein [Myroides sp. R163-1]MDM1054543.1 hypothetical protein [Myroides sp. 1354]MDM1067840.1 hypothetical protein [Myroides sp. 1372]